MVLIAAEAAGARVMEAPATAWAAALVELAAAAVGMSASWALSSAPAFATGQPVVPV